MKCIHSSLRHHPGRDTSLHRIIRSRVSSFTGISRAFSLGRIVFTTDEADNATRPEVRVEYFVSIRFEDSDPEVILPSPAKSFLAIDDIDFIPHQVFL